MCSNTFHSASGSSALVGSSKTRIWASRTNARASATFCHSPTLSSSPSSNHLPSMRVVAVAQPGDDLVGAGVAGGRLDDRRVVRRRSVDVADADVLARRELVLGEVLEDDAHRPAQVDDVESRAGRSPSRVMRARLRVVETAEQLDQRGLARAVGPTSAATSPGRIVRSMSCSAVRSVSG